ncbi:hypothetical protein CBL_03876 [Carabus blaptoides fortunei]
MSKQVKNCAGKESFHRMNFLFQASNYTASVSYKSDTKHLAKCADFISNYYSNLAINIAKKSVLRIGIDVKRSICKGCRGNQHIMLDGLVKNVIHSVFLTLNQTIHYGVNNQKH